MSFTPKDLERAHDRRLWAGTYEKAAQMIADVRREALEEAAKVAYLNDCDEAARLIRALKDGGK